MPVYKQPKPLIFSATQAVEKHFHDHDETWLVTAGRCTAFMVDRTGRKEEFELTAGDVWMVEAGVEHGCQPGPAGVSIFPFPGTIPEGSHTPGHYYMEKENYLPTLRVARSPLTRYNTASGHEK